MIDVYKPQEGSYANLGPSGPVAAALFASSVAGFAWMRTDGYSHGTKAVSELGAVGAPSALAFNILGFILPGLLVFILTIGLARRMSKKRPLIGLTLLGLSGIMMAMAGMFPIDMADETSTASVFHYTGAMLTGAFWVFSLFFLTRAFRSLSGFETIGWLTPWFALFPIANVLWQVAYGSGADILPGWGQRIGFFGYFLWVGWVVWHQGRDPVATEGRMPDNKSHR